MFGLFSRKPIIEYGSTEEGYYFFLFYNYTTLDLRELVQKFPEIIQDRYLLVTSVSSGKIDRQMFENFALQGVTGDYVDRNLILRPDSARRFIDVLFAKDSGGSTIYFLNHFPRPQELENKQIYGIPALPVSIKLFSGRKIDKELLSILLREVDSINAPFYYDNNWFEAVCVMRRQALFENLRVFFHYKFHLKEVSLGL